MTLRRAARPGRAVSRSDTRSAPGVPGRWGGRPDDLLLQSWYPYPYAPSWPRTLLTPAIGRSADARPVRSSQPYWTEPAPGLDFHLTSPRDIVSSLGEARPSEGAVRSTGGLDPKKRLDDAAT
jgi:hypothetical protein